MTINIGDKIRSLGGVEGKIVSINHERLSVMVKVPGVWRGTGLVSIPAVRITKIEEYAAANGRPWRAGGAGCTLSSGYSGAH
jgi:hypothetical protein